MFAEIQSNRVPLCLCILSDDVTMKEVGQAQLRAGELIIIVVVLIMWAGNTFTPKDLSFNQQHSSFSSSSSSCHLNAVTFLNS